MAADRNARYCAGMILNSQKQFQELRKLDFCYLCGQKFKVDEKPEPNRDHIPPKSLFAAVDRINMAFNLPTHPSCNNQRSNEDEVMGQLAGVLHGKHPESTALKNKLSLFPVAKSPEPFIGLQLPLQPIIWRWIRGFHTALYHEFIPGGIGGFILEPLPKGYMKDGRVIIDPPPKDYELWVEFIKVNRSRDSLDTIFCWGGKCRYECGWTTLDDGRNICVFALRIYNWEDLGDVRYPKRGCVGYYCPTTPVPQGAAMGTKILLPIENQKPLDPFGG